MSTDTATTTALIARSEDRPLRVAILADMLEERWPSMDLVADSLMRELPRQNAWPVAPRLVRPTLVPLIGRVLGRDGQSPPTADRVFNRFWIYPRRLASVVDGCSLFHIVDHSYAHLALSLPRQCVITTCHDVDTFRGFYGPGRIDTGLPRFLVNRLAEGLRASALVVCPSQCTAMEVVELGLAAPERVLVVPNGVDPQVVDEAADREASRLLGASEPTIDILHVGSTIERKRVDLLLQTVAALVKTTPEVRLIRAGGPFTPSQQDEVRRLGLGHRVVVLPFLSRAALLAVYRRAALLVITSDREGFGLPVVEALAAGVPVVARDLPVFREVAGDSATFVRSTEPGDWAHAISRLLAELQGSGDVRNARRETGRTQAARFSWARYAADMASLYARTAGAESQGTECQ